ncbi:sodium channel subunit beta-4-like isoform X2 [Acipenser ruthenus]|uniref:sodium channel subunit beta-4 isoform X2 n=1 Tax=Acipenser ruthenus TaxID=7906 RepID=UPI00145BAF70|nr:sodium channel subunit beta-4 isoform X2 [Acipenser ruthenus]XP_034772400.1 sodium channel subunit beta-4 isoform X2 [Acipenser ruthenus]XP_058865569.1 sodium channel subunit beta-4-like isoform X2 [Acipenser ruthenus]XP_058865570.1 sodium channel subunit beta-4-like isoform X2 [Acipenser ruthenus]
MDFQRAPSNSAARSVLVPGGSLSGGVCWEDTEPGGSERLRRAPALQLHQLHRLRGPALQVVLQQERHLGADYRVQFAGTSKTNNISIILLNVDFEDSGQYICYAKNPKEKNRVHRATYTLLVVSEMKVVDKTLTTIIASVVGGLIGFLIVFLLGKKLILFAIAKSRERKECLVSSSGIDNTENGPTGTKGNKKPTPKA